MKKKITAFFCLLLIMGMLPLMVVSLSGKSIENDGSTADSASDIHKKEKICAYAANMCGNDFCDEALRAALIIARTNYISGQKEKDNYSDKELYNRTIKIYNSNKEIYLSYKDKATYIPHSFCSNGATVKSEKYEYILSVASPWDRESAEFSNDNKCEGVSMYGINCLCEKGYSAEEALMHYLPYFDIKKT